MRRWKCAHGKERCYVETEEVVGIVEETAGAG